MTKDLPSPELLRKLLRYEPATGKLFWRKRQESMFPTLQYAKIWNKRFAGKEAFTTCNELGYKKGYILTKMSRAHRVIWAMQTGEWPKEHIDHINSNPSDNRIENLREASKSENAWNACMPKNNTLGYKGVCFDKRRGTYFATIMAHRKRYYLGKFDTPEEAHAAYCKAAAQYHKEFANTGVAT